MISLDRDECVISRNRLSQILINHLNFWKYEGSRNDHCAWSNGGNGGNMNKFKELAVTRQATTTIF